MPGATFSSTLRFSTIASGGTRPWAISARPSSRSLPWRHELTMVSAIPGEDHFAGTSRCDYCGPIPDKPKHNLMRDDRQMDAELEFPLDQILTVLRKGKLTREGATGRIVAQLGMSHCDAPTDRFSPRLLSGFGVMGSELVVNRPREAESLRVGSDRDVDPLEALVVEESESHGGPDQVDDPARRSEVL